LSFRVSGQPMTEDQNPTLSRPAQTFKARQHKTSSIWQIPGLAYAIASSLWGKRATRGLREQATRRPQYRVALRSLTSGCEQGWEQIQAPRLSKHSCSTLPVILTAPLPAAIFRARTKAGGF